MTMYDSPLAELERQQCYSADVSVLAGTVLIPESERASTQPESSPTQPDNTTSSSEVDSSSAVADTLSRSDGSDASTSRIHQQGLPGP